MQSKETRICLLMCFAILGVAGCSLVARSDNGASEAREGWNPQALEIANGLADKLHEAGVECREFSAASVDGYGEGFQKRLPVTPSAVANCTTHGDEDLTFEVFAEANDAERFMRAKLKMLCALIKANNIPEFPGLPYVDGGVWLIEPDELETAKELVPILGGKARMATCEEFAQ